MREMLPYIGYLLLQTFVIVVGFNVVNEKEYGIGGILKSWIFGQMLLFSLLQLLAVPMILFRWHFNVLFWMYVGTGLVLVILGLKNLKKIRLTRKKLSFVSFFLFLIIVLLVAYQVCIYLFGIHLDEDDARWLAEANDALEYGDMMTRSFYTGEYVAGFVSLAEVTSPWPLMFSVLSRILGIRVVIVAHTLYPSIEILTVYGIYWLIAKELFKKQEAQLVFLLFVGIVMLYCGGTVYTQSVFTLVRLWQGKATVAAVVIPLFLYVFICIHNGNKTGDWLKLLFLGMASCLMSGMGISISLIMIGVYGIYHIIAYQHWKRIPFWITCMTPSIIYALTYYYLKG